MTTNNQFSSSIQNNPFIYRRLLADINIFWRINFDPTSYSTTLTKITIEKFPKEKYQKYLKGQI